jgi:hypothetical protein
MPEVDVKRQRSRRTGQSGRKMLCFRRCVRNVTATASCEAGPEGL